jgi:hypothetical protein
MEMNQISGLDDRHTDEISALLAVAAERSFIAAGQSIESFGRDNYAENFFIDAARARGCVDSYTRARIGAWAQQPPPVRIRGTVESVDGATLMIKSGDGIDMKVRMTDNVAVFGVAKTAISPSRQTFSIG